MTTRELPATLEHMGSAEWSVGSDTWRELVDGMSDGVAVIDASGVTRYVNRSFCELVGFSREELIGGSAPFLYWPPEETETNARAFRRTLRGDFEDFELVFMKSDGERFPVSLHPSQVRSEGRLVGYAATVKDLSQHHRAQQAVRESEELWRSVVENPFDYVVTIDRRYRITYINRTSPDRDLKDLIGRATPFDFVDEKYHDPMRLALSGALERGQPGSYDVHVPDLDQWFSTIVGPIFKEGDVVGASLLSRDVTVQKQAELALRQSQRMEALGRLAGGIAHDFNNLLTPIVGNASLVQSGLPEGQDHDLLSDVIVAANRARDLVSRVLVFGRGASLERQPVYVQAIAEEVVRLLRAGAPPEVEIVSQLDARCPPVDGVPSEVHQLVTNLCTNAVQALGARGGRVEVTLSRVEEAPEPIAPPARLGGPSGEVVRPHSLAPSEPVWVRLRVEDSGTGIDETLRSKVFEPFFTTREVGEGTGLGLSIVQAIVTRYGGRVTLASGRDGGARFEVQLRALEERGRESSDERSPRESGGPSPLRVVCIDDEALVLRFLVRVLERAGHEVWSFEDPEEALDYLRQHAGELDWVVSDESMPHLRGSELARELQRLAPELPFVLLSGDTGKVPEDLSDNVRHLVQKPIDARRLRELLARRSDSD